MKHAAGLWLAAGLIVVFALAVSCEREIPGLVSPPIVDNLPPTPENLQTIVGDRTVILSWSVPDTSNILFYRVFFSDSTASNYQLLDEVEGTSCEANNLQNGNMYYFRVASVSKSRFEGYTCPSVSAIPNLYTILINNGGQYTNNENVTLSLLAPAGTRYMQVSNQASFEGASWENFSPARSWEIEAGDGSKSVYVRFRDRLDNPTLNHYSDDIILDTQAYIDSVEFSPVGVPLITGDRVNFRLFTGENEGQTTIIIGQNLAAINLYDDGSRGDLVADDGVYCGYYDIGNGLDFENASVIGVFTDKAGNRAEDSRCRYNISVRRNPDPVTIFSITNDNDSFDHLILNWSSSEINDFAQYRVYRSTSASVDSTDYLARLITSAGINSLTDTGLAENTAYYYKIYVVDNTNLWAGSNEVSASTGEDMPPPPVTMLAIDTEPDAYQDVNLSWSQAGFEDFCEYRIYTWRESFRNDSILIAVLNNNNTTSYTHHPSFPAGVDTFDQQYIIHTFDDGGNSSASNIVIANLLDLIPGQLEGAVIPDEDFIRVSWIPTEIPDFDHYRVLRDTLSVPNQAITVYISSDQAIGSYEDRNTNQGRMYYYWIDVYDQRGHSSRTFLGNTRW